MAVRYWVGGGSGNAWGNVSPTNWSASSGGPNDASIPGITDDVIFDGVGPNAKGISLIGATTTVFSVTFTSGFTGTLTFNSSVVLLVIAAGGSVTLGANMNIGSVGVLQPAGNCTLTSNGKIWAAAFSATGLGTTKTFVDNWTIAGLFTANTNGAQTYNGSVVALLGGLTITNTAENMSGTTKFVLKGGTWTGNGIMQNDLDIDGNIFIVGGGLDYTTGTMRHISGVVTTTGSLLQIDGTCTLDTAGILWNNITIFAGTPVINLVSKLRVAGTLAINTAINASFAGAAGFDAGLLNCLHQGASTVTLKNGITYNVGGFVASSSRTNAALTFTSDHATNRAILNVSPGAVCNILANFIRIDCSGGRQVPTWNGVVTDSPNVVSFKEIAASLTRSAAA